MQLACQQLFRNIWRYSAARNRHDRDGARGRVRSGRLAPGEPGPGAGRKADRVALKKAAPAETGREMVARPSAEGASQSVTDARFFQSAKRLILLLFINQLPGCPLFQVHERAQRCTAHPRKIHAKQELVGPCEPRAHFDLSVQCPMYRAAICNL